MFACLPVLGRNFNVFTIFILLTFPLSVQAQLLSSTQASTKVATAGLSAATFRLNNETSLKGWQGLVAILAHENIDQSLLVATFSDPRMPRYEGLIYSLNPRESSYNYRKHNTAANRSRALAFYKANRQYFNRASKKFHVSEAVILSLLQVETHCGAFTGTAPVLPALARLAAAGLPSNIKSNMAYHGAERSRRTALLVAQRGQELRETFLPHVAAVFRYAQLKKLDPLSLKGSVSGAIGYPQFLPGNYFRFGEDGDGDGTIDLYAAGDSIFSVARYLNYYGWNKDKMTPKEKSSVIWHYNHSAPYVATVLQMASILEPQISTKRKH